MHSNFLIYKIAIIYDSETAFEDNDDDRVCQAMDKLDFNSIVTNRLNEDCADIVKRHDIKVIVEEY